MKKLFFHHIGELIASVILGLLEVLALSLFYKDTLTFWTASVPNLLLLIALWLVCAALFYAAFRFAQFVFSPKQVMCAKDVRKKAHPANKKPFFLARFARAHPFFFAVLVLAVCYLPWLIVFYPGSAVYDMMYQTVQADGFILMNAHHPIFASLVMGVLSKFGLALTGSLNLGIFLYILLQTVLCILSFASMLSYLASIGVCKGFRYAILGFFALLPLWGGAMQSGTKDIVFTGLFVLFLVQSAKLLSNKERLFAKEESRVKKAGFWLSYAVLLLLLCLYRNAIFVIMIPTALVFFLLLRKEKRVRKYFVLSALFAFALFFVFQSVTKRVYHAKTETGEILAIPFQATARYVRDHAEKMTAEEIAMVEQTFVLRDYKELGELYYSMASDPLKARYLWWASEQEPEVLKTYVKHWFSMLKKEPLTYAEAVLLQTCGYYTVLPQIQKQKYGAGTTVQFYPDTYAAKDAIKKSEGTLSEGIVPFTPEGLKPAQNALAAYYNWWKGAPVLGIFFKCGFYVLLLLALTMFHAKKRNRLTVLTIPCFLLVLMAIASPLNEHIRYILPVVAALPLVIGAASAEDIKKDRTCGGME